MSGIYSELNGPRCRMKGFTAEGHEKRSWLRYTRTLSLPPPAPSAHAPLTGAAETALGACPGSSVLSSAGQQSSADGEVSGSKRNWLRDPSPKHAAAPRETGGLETTRLCMIFVCQLGLSSPQGTHM